MRVDPVQVPRLLGDSLETVAQTDVKIKIYKKEVVRLTKYSNR
jgi:hypothetical protein